MTKQVDGHIIEHHKVRFSGSVDDIDDELGKVDRVVMLVVSARVKSKKQQTDSNGEVTETIEFNVQDAVPLTGELRDQAISFLAHGADQGYLNLGVPRHDPEPELPPAGVDSNGEIGVPQVAAYAAPAEQADDIFDVPVVKDEGTVSGTVVVGHVSDARHGKPSGGSGEGPGVGKVDFAAFGAGAAADPAVERVGSVYGRQRKDNVLQDFMDEEVEI